MTKRRLNVVLAIMIAVAVIFAGVGILSCWTEAGYYVDTEEEARSNGTTVKTIMKRDRNGEVVATTDHLVFNKEGELVDALGYEGSLLVPLSQEEIEKNGIVHVGNLHFSKYSFFIYGVILELPLLVIYSIWKSRLKKKKAVDEIKKMKLESL